MQRPGFTNHVDGGAACCQCQPPVTNRLAVCFQCWLITGPSLLLTKEQQTQRNPPETSSLRPKPYIYICSFFHPMMLSNPKLKLVTKGWSSLRESAEMVITASCSASPHGTFFAFLFFFSESLFKNRLLSFTFFSSLCWWLILQQLQRLQKTSIFERTKIIYATCTTV